MSASKNSVRATSLVRPLIRRLKPYVPGEQPKIPGLIKLNTNENPYPPSPKVLAAIKAATDGRLRLYPDASAQELREKLARHHGCAPENIIVGNGSDELLAMAVRCFADPALDRRSGSKSRVQFFVPSYSLYPVLAAIQGSTANGVALAESFKMPALSELERGREWDFKAALTFLTTPNAPSGCGCGTEELDRLCREHKGVIILDEAYVDFARENALALCLKYPHVIVARTFSKAYSLCLQRVGYLVGNPELIGALQKIRDSYNVNGLGQVAALATLDDLPYYHANFQKIISTRDLLTEQLTALGFKVVPSQTNFIFAKPVGDSAKNWLQKLRRRKILVRWFDQAPIRPYLRITIGTPEQAQALLRAIRAELAK
jgi:histidinol-phosphate aminotransferase